MAGTLGQAGGRGVASGEGVRICRCPRWCQRSWCTIQTSGGISAGSGGGVGYRGALGGTGAAGAPTGQPGGPAGGQRGGVAYVGAWRSAGGVGAPCYGQMGMLILGPGGEFRLRWRSGRCWSHRRLPRIGGRGHREPWWRVGHGGAMGSAGVPSDPYGQPGGLALSPAKLWAVPEPSARHRSDSAKQPTTGWAHGGSVGLSCEMAAPATSRPLLGRRSTKQTPPAP